MSSLHISETYTPAVAIIPEVGDNWSAFPKRIHTQQEIRDILTHEARQLSQGYDIGWGEWN